MKKGRFHCWHEAADHSIFSKEGLEYLTSNRRVQYNVLSHVQDLLGGANRVPNYGGRATGHHVANCVGDVGRLYRFFRMA